MTAHKLVLELAVVLVVCWIVGIVMAVALWLLFDVTDGPWMWIAQGFVGLLIGWRIARWQARQDELEETRAEVDS